MMMPSATSTGALDWQVGKQAHLDLSEAAAEKYDEMYENSNFATGSYMHYEIEILEHHAHQAPDHLMAIDLGCGTGRDSWVLSKRFDQVFAFDFSPAMIRVAEATKLSRRMGNVLFRVRDVELGLWDIADGSASFVNSSFGMASFVQNLEEFFREVRRLLKPKGLAIFSFYNSSALVNKLDLQWRPALAARLPTDGSDGLDVDFGGTIRRISARAYALPYIQRVAEANFELVSLTTYPTLTALFPQELFEDPTARELCSNVDRLLSSNLEIGAGPYIIVVARKKGPSHRPRQRRGYERVLELLEVHKVPKSIREHGPVRSMAAVEAVLDIPGSEMVKSILVSVAARPNSDARSAALFLFGVPADRKLDLAKAARLLSSPRQALALATQVQVEELTGFTVGSIPPFGMPKNVPTILDERLLTHERVWCGTGKATESLEVSVDNLRKLSACTVGDVSKPL